MTPSVPPLLTASLLVGAITVPRTLAAAISLEAFASRADPAHVLVEAPPFETTAEQVKANAETAVRDGTAALDRIARQQGVETTFASTFGAVDQAVAKAAAVAERIGFLQQCHPSPALRAAASDAVKSMEDWLVSIDYREDLYRTLKAAAAAHPPGTAEDTRLMEFTLRDYRRAGFDLPVLERRRVEELRKQLSAMETDYQTNINESHESLVFTRAELAGVPDDFLDNPAVKKGPDAYSVAIDVTPQRIVVENNCTVAATRRRVTAAEFNLTKAKNIPLLNRMVEVRAELARRLGYASWDDFVTEVKMARNGATALGFVRDLYHGIEPKYRAELAEMNALKAQETHDPSAQVDITDWRYYQNRLVKEKFTIDTEALRVYFPFQRCLSGMFAIYSSIFGIKFEEIQPPSVWADGVTLWGVSDAGTGKPLGLFYLDMFPREGKFNHFAEFSIQPCRQLADGRVVRPVAGLLCNFPLPAPDKPSLLDHQEVQTLFHEFGHCMHEILTTEHRNRFAGTAVPRDFVEAPSQMLENWVFDKAVLDTFAADYRDPSRKVPAEILKRMNEVRLGTVGVTYRRQFALAYLDLVLHAPRAAGAPVDSAEETNRAWDEVFLAVPPHSAFVARFGHLAGYDAGYYGYAWADAIAADMATVFQSAPHGFLDPQAGRRMRDEIYAQGDSRDVSESIERFLGRPRSLAPFLKRLGITSAPPVQ